jgi:ADP-dependent NAD(P)H-hydrate dehydratase / NAD(P)H-hydrate epimerase
MKILNGKQSRALDLYTIEKQGIASVELMHRAADAFTKWFTLKFGVTSRRIFIFCGKGNNGGDGYAIGERLHKKGYAVTIVPLISVSPMSRDCLFQFERLKSLGDISFAESIQYAKDSIVIEAIFGTGLNRPLDGIARDWIEAMNRQPAYAKIAIDMPAGLYTDQPGSEIAFMADFTFGFECPKLAYWLPENEKYVGEWVVESIGLDHSFLEQMETNLIGIEEEYVRLRLKPVNKFDHKGKRGHALLLVGSFGKIGAAVLASKSALRSGCGLVTIQTPACGYMILQSTVPEAMCIADKHFTVLSKLIELKPYQAIGVGCGIGTDKMTEKWFGKLLNICQKPIVIDADGLNILARQKKWWSSVPKGSILTPHPGEFERLTGRFKNDYEKLEKLSALAKTLESIIVLKGAHTAIACPTGNIYFNTTGNPGMAKGGSGDILTGLITGLLASGYHSLEAAIVGVWLHGKAGDIAAEQLSMTGMKSGDIIDYLPLAFK